MADAAYTGRKISDARKAIGITQKELAEKLMVTDKAVSKWERGINYPDIALLKPLSEILDLSLAQLLCEEETTLEQAIQITTEISMEEKKVLKRMLKLRWILNIILSIGIMGANYYLSYLLAEKELFGVYQVLSQGLAAWQALIIGNTLFSLHNIKKTW